MKVKSIRDSLPVHKKRKWKKRRRQIQNVFVHCTGSENQSPFETARYHIRPNHISKKGCPGLCYHDYIVKSGTIFLCNDYGKVVWHTKGNNYTGIGVVVAYNPESGPMPDPAYSSLVAHVSNLMLLCCLEPRDVMGHREAKSNMLLDRNGSVRLKKTCPGMSVNLDKLRRDIAESAQLFLWSEGLYNGRIDGIWGRLSRKGAGVWRSAHE